MAEPPGDSRFLREVSEKEARKLRAQRTVMHTVWSGFGMMGLIGWSVSIPTLLGALLGSWLDKHYPASHSWMLTLLLTGVLIGCLNAWRWVKKEEKVINTELQDKKTGKGKHGGN